MMVDFRNILMGLEVRLQTFVEGNLARVFPGKDTPHDLAIRLETAMRSQLRSDSQGFLIAPNFFQLQVHPDHLSSLQMDPSLVDDLALALRDAGLEVGLSFQSPPVVRLASSPSLGWGDIRVIARHSQENLPETNAVQISRSEFPVEMPKNAFLIVDGMRMFSLQQQVINIGRRLDNQLVIDDTRVSRLHAQLRLVKGHFVIFDLDSMGGTWVNGERIQQRTLQPGDVISLSGLPLVFSCDQILPDETQEFTPDLP